MKNNYPPVLFFTILFFFFNNSILSGQGNWKNILKDYQFTDLIFAEDHVWISTDSVGLELYCYGGDFYHRVDMTDGLPSNQIRAIKKNEGDEIWIGTDAGIAFFGGEVWTILNEENSNLLSNDVKDIQVTNSGKIWIGFDHAIQSFDPQNDIWELFDASNISFFPDSTFINMEVDADDIVWAAFPHNLIKFSQEIEKYTLPPKITWINLNFFPFTMIDTTYSEIHFISKDSDGKIRAVNGYDSNINELSYTISFGYGRDIGGIIHEVSQRNYWWGGGSRISNAIYHESTDLSTCVNPDIIRYYQNDSMSFGGLRKAPLRFSPSKKLWIIHKNGISILNAGNSDEPCEKKEIIKPEIIVYPNPSNGLLNLNFAETLFGKINLRVYNTNGQLFLEKDIYNNLENLDLTHLKYGIYILEFTSRDWTHVEKISIF